MTSAPGPTRNAALATAQACVRELTPRHAGPDPGGELRSNFSTSPCSFGP